MSTDLILSTQSKIYTKCYMLTYFIYTLGFHRAEAINTTKHETLNLMYVWILKQHIFLCMFFFNSQSEI